MREGGLSRFLYTPWSEAQPITMSGLLVDAVSNRLLPAQNVCLIAWTNPRQLTALHVECREFRETFGSLPHP